MRFAFPSVMEMNEALTSSIAQECGCSSLRKEREEFLREVLVLVVLAIFPGLPFRKLAEAAEVYPELF